MPGRLFLIHWKAEEAEELAQPLKEQGWQVAVEAEDGARAVRAIKAIPPDAVVVYLTRLPSHGRETGDALQSARAMRDIPLVFVGGAGEALEKTRAKVPNAVYTTPAELDGVLAHLTSAGAMGRTGATPTAPPPPPETGFRKISEASVRARTGKGWEEWLTILDAWDAPAQGHTRSARYLQEQHGVSPWWAQAVVIRYEWERGLRT